MLERICSRGRILSLRRFRNLMGSESSRNVLPSSVRHQYATSSSSTASSSDSDNSNTVSTEESSTTSTSAASSSSKPQSKGGFADALARFEGHENFTKMLRKSSFIQMGDPQGKIVEGKIVHVVNDDLYIDFGYKFNCVCLRPARNGGAYTLGKRVRILVHDLELSTRFLGASTDLTILEADCTLLGLAGRQNPSATETEQQQQITS